MVFDTFPHAYPASPLATSTSSRLSDQEFCRRAMRDGIEGLGLSLEELLRGALPKQDAV